MTRKSNGSSYIPTLDGWRAIAISAVVILHSQQGPVTASARHLTEWGGLGVDLFFAISGILICSRLLEEERMTGAISLKGFYIRRFFRILPAAYAFLLVCVLLEIARVLPSDTPGILASIFMVRNYYYWLGSAGRDAWYTAHFWSLSVEEHFYLLLPGLLFLVRKRRVLVLGLLVLLFGGWRLFVEHSPAFHGKGLWLNTEMRLHSLLIPALFAVLLARRKPRAWMARWITPFAALALLLFAGLATHELGVHGVLWSLIIPVCFPLIVLGTMLHPATLIGGFLESAPLRYIGRISYSLYLWQMLFFRSGQSLAAPPLGYLQIFPWNFLALSCCALTSYYLIEKPMVRIGHRLAPPVTPGRE